MKPDDSCYTSCAAAWEVNQGGSKAVADNRSNIHQRLDLMLQVCSSNAGAETCLHRKKPLKCRTLCKMAGLQDWTNYGMLLETHFPASLVSTSGLWCVHTGLLSGRRPTLRTSARWPSSWDASGACGNGARHHIRLHEAASPRSSSAPLLPTLQLGQPHLGQSHAPISQRREGGSTRGLREKTAHRWHASRRGWCKSCG